MRLVPRSLRSRLTIEATVAGGVLVALVATVVSKATRAHVALVLAMPLALGLVAVGAWALVGAVLQPVRKLADEANRLSVNSPGQRLPVTTSDGEIAALTSRLNDLIDRVERSMERERTFVDDASHELRTPITVLRGELELAMIELEGADLTAAPDAIVDALRPPLLAALGEVERLGRLADDLLVLARLERGELRMRRQAFDVRAAADEVCRRLGTTRPTTSVTGDTVLVNADPVRLGQVLTNLVSNARRHALAIVQVTVRDLGGDGAEVVVSDDGRGFADHVLPIAFRRFTRAESARSRRIGGSGVSGGSGLGLAISAAIIDAHGGTIHASNGPPLGGASVVVHLPLGTPARSSDL